MILSLSDANTFEFFKKTKNNFNAMYLEAIFNTSISMLMLKAKSINEMQTFWSFDKFMLLVKPYLLI